MSNTRTPKTTFGFVVSKVSEPLKQNDDATISATQDNPDIANRNPQDVPYGYDDINYYEITYNYGSFVGNASVLPNAVDVTVSTNTRHNNNHDDYQIKIVNNHPISYEVISNEWKDNQSEFKEPLFYNMPNKNEIVNKPEKGNSSIPKSQSINDFNEDQLFNGHDSALILMTEIHNANQECTILLNEKIKDITAKIMGYANSSTNLLSDFSTIIKIGKSLKLTLFEPAHTKICDEFLKKINTLITIPTNHDSIIKMHSLLQMLNDLLHDKSLVNSTRLGPKIISPLLDECRKKYREAIAELLEHEDDICNNRKFKDKYEYIIKKEKLLITIENIKKLKLCQFTDSIDKLKNAYRMIKNETYFDNTEWEKLTKIALSDIELEKLTKIEALSKIEKFLKTDLKHVFEEYKSILNSGMDNHLELSRRLQRL